MLDVVIEGGRIVDGTGRPGWRGDVGIAGGRVVAVGQVDEPARRRVEADGRVVCPGFVDVHTHYDAQVFWDPTLSPSPLHGVTTVIAGNCGLSLAPAAPEDVDFLVRMLSRVEAIPLESLEAGVPFTWRTFPELLDAIDRLALVPNIGVAAGHSAIRRAVMKERASSGVATPEELRAMVEVLGEALAAGAIGFSSSTSATQRDGDGAPTPPNFALPDELVGLAAACAGHPGTTVEFIPASSAYGFTDDELELMAAMSVAARRPLNWNTILFNYPAIPDLADRQLRSADVGAAAGGWVVPMVIPHNFRVRTDFRESDVGFRSLPGFEDLFRRPEEERVAALADAEVRASLVASLAAAAPGSNAMFRDSLDEQLVSDTGDPALAPLLGRRVADIAAERGTGLVETFFDLAVESRLDVGFVRHLAPCDTPERRALRRRVLRDRRVVLGASDGGAHTRGVLNVEYTTACFAELVRDDDVFTLEEMVQELTDVPARLYGLTGRGRLEEGAWADVVVFDPATIAPSPVGFVRDLPGGAGRLFNHGLGIDAVLVAGEPVVEKGAFTGATPGRLLRSGRHTVTTPPHRLLERHRPGREG
ncbi:MAG: N-acyl-D-amino-acid deacylase family protein [Acidimicrobiales bacterium]